MTLKARCVPTLIYFTLSRAIWHTNRPFILHVAFAVGEGGGGAFKNVFTLHPLNMVQTLVLYIFGLYSNNCTKMYILNVFSYVRDMRDARVPVVVLVIVPDLYSCSSYCIFIFPNQ